MQILLLYDLSVCEASSFDEKDFSIKTRNQGFMAHLIYLIAMKSITNNQSQIGLTDLRVRSRVGGRSASHAHRASRTSTGRGSTILGLA